jgi:hypothetical protein
MSSFVNIAELTNINFKYRELTFKEYRILNKCLLDDQLNVSLIFTNLNLILNNCILDNKKNNILNKINYIDYIIFILLLRGISAGNIVRLTVKNSANNNLTLDIDLKKIVELLHNLDYNNLLTPTILDTQNIKITYQLPSIDDIISYTEKAEDSIYNSFINEIIIEDTTIIFKELNLQDQNKILQQLPAKLFTNIIKKVQDIIKYFEKINFFTSVYNKDIFNTVLPLIPNAEIICFIVKILFNTDLETLYGNMFALINGSHFTGEYLDSCTPGEFYVYCKKLEQYISEQNKQINSTTSVTNQFTDNFELEQP